MCLEMNFLQITVIPAEEKDKSKEYPQMNLYGMQENNKKKQFHICLFSLEQC